MARPEAGAPPVRSSAVATRPRDSQIETYRSIADLMRRPDRWADLVAMTGSVEAAERFLSVAMSYIASGRDLLDSTPESLIQAIKDAAVLGLEPTGVAGEAAIVTYAGVARLQPMYRGILKRVRNTQQVDFIDCPPPVMEADEFEYGWTERGFWFRHNPDKLDLGAAPDGTPRGRGGYVKFYAYAVMPSGYVHGEVMADSEVREVRDQYSRAYQRWLRDQTKEPPPWVKSYAEMGRKTVLLRMGKRMPQSAFDQRLLELDAMAERAADDATATVRRIDVTSARQRAIEAARGLPAPASRQLPAGEAAAAEAQAAQTEEEMLADARAATEVAARPDQGQEEPLDF